MTHPALLAIAPPGAGASTMFKHLSLKNPEFSYVSSGDCIRAFKTNEPDHPYTSAIQKMEETGTLLDDEKTRFIVEKYLEGIEGKTLLLDKVIRKVSQIRFEEDLNLDLLGVIHFVVPYEEIERRLLARGRQGETEEIIRKRLATYRKETAPLLTYYKDKGKVKKM